jgi:nitrogen fixation protein NifQ
MEPTAIYVWLINDDEGKLRDTFDAHVLASLLAVSFAEAKALGSPLSESTGLTSATLTAMMSAAFPHALPLLEQFDGCEEPSFPEDERSLRELLARSTTSRKPFQLHLAALIARRAMRPNHLWQDCGLRNRGELSEMMNRHFEPLASRNSSNMKWKKFLYRMICRDEGFRLCTSPSCAECDDFSVCFGDETGESLLARNRRAAELTVLASTSL